jgi:NitT/TauT family transport system ATP-binding protein
MNSVDGKSSFVSIRRADMRYGNGEESEQLALQRVSMEIARGEFAVVVGPSGCGKSTLMKMLSGLVRASSGDVLIDGEQVVPPVKIVGMAFQNPALLPWRTALENVLLPIQVVSPHRQHFRRDRLAFEERAKGLLSLVGLSGVANLYGWQLSGGMQQRVSLCRALMHDPQILLLDEPFSALDAFTREELWDTLQALWLERQCTVLLVTHDLNEAVYLADTVHVMSARPGRIIHKVNVDLSRPRREDTRFTAPFVELVHDVRRHIKHAGTE